MSVGALAGLIGASWLPLEAAWAQASSSPTPGEIFGREREGLEEFGTEVEPRLSPPSQGLPPLAPSPEGSPFAAEAGVRVRGFRILGSTLFSQAELSEAVDPFLGRALRSEDLPALTDALTQLYVDQGYVSSGATLPDQNLADGILEIHIVEGGLAEVVLGEGGHLSDRWVTDRLRDASKAPLNLGEIERALRVLQRERMVARVDAVLIPTERLGESILRLEIEEESPWQLEFRGANDISPALGGKRGEVRVGHRNVFGMGDRIQLAFSGGEGLIDFDGRYTTTVTPFLTDLEVFGDFGRGKIVAGDFDDADLDFRSEVERYGIALTQPILRSVSDDLRFRISFERRRSRVEFRDGFDLQFETVDEEDGRVSLSLLRTSIDWVHRTRDQVFALRLQGSFGLDTWDATTPNNTAPPGADLALPDGEFQSGLLQIQLARRFETRLGDGEFVLRQDLQLASGSLFSLEALSVGGASTVRGYHENEFLSDNGWIGSIEFRLPVFPPSLRPHALRVIPFLDLAAIWNDRTDGLERFKTELGSVGIGLAYRYADRFEFAGHVGVPFLDRPRNVDGDALQNVGIHLEARIFAF